MGFSQNRGYLFRGPNIKDYSILGSILGSPILGNYHIIVYYIILQYGILHYIIFADMGMYGLCLLANIIIMFQAFS